MRLYEKLKKPNSGSRKKLAMPRALTLFQKCVEHHVQDCLIKQLHYNDLYVLISSIDINNYNEMLRNKRSDAMKKRNIEVCDVSQADALKFLKGGG